MLSLTEVRKTFNNIPAIDNLSIEVNKGKTFALLGPNGAGKTTTIRMIMNIIRPDSGNILFKNEVFSEATRNRIGYLPEERGLYQKMKLFNTLHYLGKLKNMGKQDVKEQIQYWLDRFDLLPFAQKNIEELSKGNQQKVQFIVAVLNRPELIILDEPFSGLDPINQDLIKEIIRERKEDGFTTILSTHDMAQAEKLSDDICIIDKGKRILYGSLKEIKKQYGSKSIYLEFFGNKSIFETSSMFKKVDLYENAAEVIIADKIKASEVIDYLSDKIEIRKFEVVEPSLHHIFIEYVQGIRGK